jgi:sulfite exporter TauE/SafE
MTAELSALIITAASIGFFHTLFGPDHYLPFIMISWARKWSTVKTAVITLLCGLGHIGSSVVLGLIGVALGLAVKKLEFVESFRGNIAAWLLIAFGLAYLIWGLRRAYRNQPHSHHHTHFGIDTHSHSHSHFEEHTHIHNGKSFYSAQDGSALSITPWVLFAIFVFGPCEPLIPLVMYPAAKNNFSGLILVTFVFGFITIATMLSLVLLSRAGVNLIPLAGVQRFAHAIAGATILLCGLAIVFLGL